MKRSENKTILTEREIKILAEKIREKFNPQKIILFGSYASGNPGASSDIDLLVIMDTKEPYPRQAAKIRLYLDETLGVIAPIDIIVRTPQEVKRRVELGDFFFIDILTKGIHL
jgi:predicted nucleotidyltransferase